MKNHLAKAVLIGLMINIAAPAAFAAHPELAGLGQIKFSAPGVPRYVLDNGLVVYIVKDNTLPVIHMSAFIKAGSAYDPAEKIGLAQMTAALLRDGGTAGYKAEDIDKTLEYLGASLDSGAYTEETQAEMTTLKKDLEKVLDIYADVLRNPAFEEEKIKIARDESLEIIRRRNDNPSKAASREAKRMFYGPAHPYGRRSEESTINAISKADLAAFHAANFKPNNMILAVSGDFASDEAMLALLKAKFGDWKSGEVSRPVIPAPAYAGGRKVYLIDKDVSQTSIVLTQPGLARVNPENYPLSVLTDIIGGGFESRLFSEVRTKRGLAYSVQASNANLSEGGFLYTFCGTKAETYSQALTEMLKQLGLVGSEPVSKEELERSKGSTINPFVFKFSTPHKLATERALEEFYGYKKGYLDSYVEDVSKVDSARTLAVGAKYFNPANAQIFVIGNSKKFDKPLSEFGAVTELKED